MSSVGAQSAGERIATARKLRRMTQPQLAEAAAISASLLRKIEQGSRPVTPAVWSSIAGALDLAGPGDATPAQWAASRVEVALPLLRYALDCYDLPEDGPVRSLRELRAATEVATARRLAADYARLADSVPGLITALTRAAHADSGDGQQAAALLTLAYRAANSIAEKFGHPDLSARTVDRMCWAAARSGDPALVAVAAYVRAEIFLEDHPAAGIRVLDAASADLLRDGPSDKLVIYGTLHMRAGVYAAYAGQPALAESHLAEARDVSRHFPDAIYRGTAFGPANVRIHEIGAAAEMGDREAVLHKAAGWQPPLSVPAERRSRYFIELARAQLWAGQRDEALASLDAGRRIAPQDVRHNPRVHETASTLIRLQRNPSEPLLGFARWAGINSRRP